MKLIQVTLAAITAGAFLISCDEECTENRNALPLAGFYNSAVPNQQVTVDSLEVAGIGAPGDSVLSSVAVAKEEVYLPFRVDADTTVYVFRYKRSDLAAVDATDTIRFVYTRNPRFVSAECGVSYVFDMEDIHTTHLMIDSVECPNGFIDNVNAHNLKIYFRTQTDAD